MRLDYFVAHTYIHTLNYVDEKGSFMSDKELGRYMKPQMVRSPKSRLSSVRVIEDQGENEWSLAEVVWDGQKCLAMRWNGSFSDESHNVGTPQSRGLPMWFILPSESLFFELLEKHRKEM